jgi:hypothetical protein
MQWGNPLFNLKKNILFILLIPCCPLAENNLGLLHHSKDDIKKSTTAHLPRTRISCRVLMLH